jgi:hypothetical protein
VIAVVRCVIGTWVFVFMYAVRAPLLTTVLQMLSIFIKLLSHILRRHLQLLLHHHRLLLPPLLPHRRHLHRPRFTRRPLLRLQLFLQLQLLPLLYLQLRLRFLRLHRCPLLPPLLTRRPFPQLLPSSPVKANASPAAARDVTPSTVLATRAQQGRTRPTARTAPAAACAP